MTDEPISLAEQRALKAEDSRLWSPLDALRATVRRLEAGEIKPTQLAILYFEGDPDVGRQFHHVIANLTFEGQLALLEIARADLMERWRA